jgi:hypothetical protein
LYANGKRISLLRRDFAAPGDWKKNYRKELARKYPGVRLDE